MTWKLVGATHEGKTTLKVWAGKELPILRYIRRVGRCRSVYYCHGADPRTFKTLGFLARSLHLEIPGGYADHWQVS